MDPYIGQITLVAFNFAPVGWAFCNGQLLPIDQNTALFQLIGTTYGGDGQTTFALPDLRSRIPLHQGQGSGTSNYTIGQIGGSEQVTLTSDQVPSHTHQAQCFTGGSNSQSPVNGLWAQASIDQPYKGRDDGSGQHGPGRDRPGRRESAAPESDGLPGTQLHHRSGGDLPTSET